MRVSRKLKIRLRLYSTLSIHIVATIVVALAVSRPVSAADIVVNSFEQSPGSAGDCTLGEAIKAANTDTAVDACAAGNGADLITLPKGVYMLTKVDNSTEKEGPNGLPDITSEIAINGAGPNMTT